MKGWVIFKHPKRRLDGKVWRVSNRPGIWILCRTHEEAVAHMNRVVEANSRPALAA